MRRMSAPERVFAVLLIAVGTAAGITLRAWTRAQALDGQAGSRARILTQAEVVREPKEWVPFAAIAEQSSDGQATQYTVARASDGSQYEGDSTGRYVAIDNQRLHRNYVRTPGGKWLSRPLEGGAKPLGSGLALDRVKVVSPEDERVVHLRGRERGLHFYEMNGGRDGKALAIYCLELNLTHVWRQMYGELFKFTSLALEEPSASLFELPPDAVVQTDETPVTRGRLKELPSQTAKRIKRWW